MSYPDNFNRRAFDEYLGGSNGDGDHNDDLAEWIKAASPAIAAFIKCEYLKRFPNGPWHEDRLLPVLRDALTDAGCLE